MENKEFCLNCKNWTSLGDSVGTCAAFCQLRLQYEGECVDIVDGVKQKFVCPAFKFAAFRKPWHERSISHDEVERARRQADAVYEQMRYERLKERPKAYWQKVRDERKQRLNMMVGGAE